MNFYASTQEFTSDFWPKLNFPLEIQIKVVLTLIQHTIILKLAHFSVEREGGVPVFQQTFVFRYLSKPNDLRLIKLVCCTN